MRTILLNHFFLMSNRSSYLDENITLFAEKCIELQKEFDMVNFENVEEIAQNILQLSFIKDEDGPHVLWDFIQTTLINTFNKTIMVPKLLSLLMLHLFTNEELKQQLLNIISDELNSQVETNNNTTNNCTKIDIKFKIPLFYFMIVNDLYDQTKLVQSLFNNKLLDHNNLYIFYFWFLPILEKKFPDLNDRILRYMKIRPPIGFEVFLKYLNTFSNNDWYLHKKFTETGYYPGTLESAIKADDISLLVSLASKNDDFDWNQSIQPSILHNCYILNQNPTLIQFAAFFGAKKCFDYLYGNGSSIMKKNTVKTIEFAVAGGNIEIIQELSEKFRIFYGSLQLSSWFHKNEVFYWIYDQSEANDLLLSASSVFVAPLFFAVKSNNIEILMFCLSEITNLENFQIKLQETDIAKMINYSKSSGELFSESYKIFSEFIDKI
ncbi:hypothetical protein TRFO_15551 [Tritrichomonas foetus]|uniref:DUF3447 domain-containing protein n=1 Tax=Tritrichomonas foetus TaxID=1144522 RepID=A0A1J4KWH6_9EUKA|nr:hypothetical protein TRFO_15551 [Tritrichomonas foetus]|eukprot:OHT14054.1 hypothetical protein TRFO_15551 [Tritrichomonas foetus]